MQRLVAHNERRKMAQRGETEDGLGWGGLVASKAELREERRQAALEKDAARYRKLRDGQNWPAAFARHDAPEPLRGADLDAACDGAA